MDLAKNISHIEYISLDIITYIWYVLLRIWLRCRYGNRRGVERYGKKLALTAGKTKREMKSDVCVCFFVSSKFGWSTGDQAKRGKDNSSPEYRFRRSFALCMGRWELFLHKSSTFIQITTELITLTQYHRIVLVVKLCGKFATFIKNSM